MLRKRAAVMEVAGDAGRAKRLRVRGRQVGAPGTLPVAVFMYAGLRTCRLREDQGKGRKAHPPAESRASS